MVSILFFCPAGARASDGAAPMRLPGYPPRSPTAAGTPFGVIGSSVLPGAQAATDKALWQASSERRLTFTEAFGLDLQRHMVDSEPIV
ncbi:MAG: hypothetical protein AMXMBFR13_29320 [Phycisphaerae bacterium]